MIRSLYFKEWLKIRWTFAAMSALSFLALVYILLNLSHTFELNGAAAFWEFVIYKRLPLGADLIYLPLISGLLVAIVQFYPEITNGRLKLTLHLPVNENSILMHMVIFSFILLTILFGLIIAAFAFIISIYFPSEVVSINILILIPVFVSGLITYTLTVAVMTEPVWKRRVPLIIFSAGIISVFFTVNDATTVYNIFSLVLTVASLSAILLSGYHYKRGIR